jgi:hypothetical protein
MRTVNEISYCNIFTDQLISHVVSQFHSQNGAFKGPSIRILSLIVQTNLSMLTPCVIFNYRNTSAGALIPDKIYTHIPCFNTSFTKTP